MFLFPVALAYAEDAAPAAGGGGFLSILPIVILFVIFYFLLIRPQQKKAKEHKEMIGSLQKGDTVVTAGGIYGRIISVNEDSLSVEIAENVRVKVAKEAVTGKKQG